MQSKINDVVSYTREHLIAAKDSWSVVKKREQFPVYSVIFLLSSLFCAAFWINGVYDDPIGIRNFSIPITPFAFAASISLLFCLGKYCKEYSLKRIGKFHYYQLFFYGFWILLLSTVVWIFSSSRYYYGVDSGLKKSADSYQKGVSLILNEANIDDEEKRRRLDYFLGKNLGQFILLKNGDEYYKKPSTTRDATHYEADSYGDNYNPILVGNDVYELSYIYYNRPYLLESYIKSVTFSCIPDLIEYDVKNYNYSYVHNRLHNRSLSFWGALLICCIAFELIWIKSIYKEYKRNANLASMLRLAFSHLHGETNHQIADSRNILQEISNLYEDDYDEHIISLNSQLEMATRKERHDLKNKWITSDAYIKNQEIQPYINMILEDLAELPEAISIAMTTCKLQELMAKAPKYIAEYQKDRSSGFTYEIDTAYGEKTMFANPHHFWSIITNLIGNAKEATGRQKRIMREKGTASTYKRYTSLKIYTSEHRLFIIVEDNGGGFPEVQKIYKEPVISSKKDAHGKAREGEGTTYIKIFTEMMGGEIEAENIRTQDGSIGARTKISFPIKDEEV